MKSIKRLKLSLTFPQCKFAADQIDRIHLRGRKKHTRKYETTEGIVFTVELLLNSESAAAKVSADNNLYLTDNF